MSRSEPNKSTNPSTKFFEWKPKKGVLQYYDKEAEENIEVPIPFTFLVLDELHTIRGGKKVGYGAKKKYSGYWSNEIRNTKTERLTVKSKDGIVAEGLYADVKSTPGVKYAKSIYIAFRDGPELVIGHLMATGSANSAWIEFSKGVNLNTCAVTLQGKTKIDGGDLDDWYEPVFKAHAVSPETDEQALELDKQLQTYLREYFSADSDEQPATDDEDESAAGRGWDEDDGEPVESNQGEQEASEVREQNDQIEAERRFEEEAAALEEEIPF